jgi:hypothetical protein
VCVSIRIVDVRVDKRGIVQSAAYISSTRVAALFVADLFEQSVAQLFAFPQFAFDLDIERGIARTTAPDTAPPHTGGRVRGDVHVHRNPWPVSHLLSKAHAAQRRGESQHELQRQTTTFVSTTAVPSEH